MISWSATTNYLKTLGVDKPYGKTRSGSVYKRSLPYTVRHRPSKLITTARSLPRSVVAPRGIGGASRSEPDDPAPSSPCTTEPESPVDDPPLPQTPENSPESPSIEEQRIALRQVVDPVALRIAINEFGVSANPVHQRRLHFDNEYQSNVTVNGVTIEYVFKDQSWFYGIKDGKFVKMQRYSGVLVWLLGDHALDGMNPWQRVSMQGSMIGVKRHESKSPTTPDYPPDSPDTNMVVTVTQPQRTSSSSPTPPMITVEEDEDEPGSVLDLYDICVHGRSVAKGKDPGNWCSSCRSERATKPTSLIDKLLSKLTPAPVRSRASSQIATDALHKAARLIVADRSIVGDEAKADQMAIVADMIEKVMANAGPVREEVWCRQCMSSGVCSHSRPADCPSTPIPQWCRNCKSQWVVSFYEPDFCAYCKSIGWVAKQGTIFLNGRRVFKP